MSADRVLKQLETLKAERLSIENTLRDCARNVDPMEGIGLNGSTLDGASNLSQSNGEKYRIYDNTASDALWDLSNAQVSGLVPSNMRWFDLDVQGEPDLRHAWLDDSADSGWREIHASNFDAIVPSLFYSSEIVGQSVVYVDWDDDKGSLVFEPWHLGGVYLSASRRGDLIDSVYRDFQMTAEQLVNRYGDKVSADTRKLAAEVPTKLIDVCHAIYPRPSGVYGGPAENKPYAEDIIEKAARHVIQSGGYDEQPFMVLRGARLIPNSNYALGAVYGALPDIKTLNDTVRMLLQSADMHIGGMWWGVNDGVLNPKTIQIGPRKVVMMAEKDNFGRLDSAGNPNFAFAEVEMLREQVRRTLRADRLAVPQQPNMTALEVSVRMELLRSQNAPLFGRRQSEFCGPLIARVMGLMIRRGLIPQPPDELQDAIVAVRYVSPLARSQRLSDVQAMDRFEAGLAAYAEIKPELLDIYDWDGATREKSYLLGVPQKFINSAAVTKKIAANRQQQQQEAANQQAQTDMLTRAAPELLRQ